MSFVIWSLLIVMTVFNQNFGLSSDVNLLTLQEPPGAVSHTILEVIRNVITKKTLDPMEFDRVEFNHPGEMFSANVNISRAIIAGLTNNKIFKFEHSKNESTFDISVQFPFLKFYAEHYELDGHIYYVVPIKGEGIAHFEIQNLQFKGKFYFKKFDMTIYKYENAELQIERILSYTEFDYNIDSIISAMVNDLLAEYINRFNKYLLVTYDDPIIKYINSILYSL